MTRDCVAVAYLTTALLGRSKVGGIGPRIDVQIGIVGAGRDRNADGGISAGVAVVEAIPDRLAGREGARELAIVGGDREGIGRATGDRTGRRSRRRRDGVGGRGWRRRGERARRGQCADKAHRAIGVVIIDLDEHDARAPRIAVGDGADVAAQRRSRTWDRTRVAWIPGEQKDVQPRRIGWFEGNGGGNDLTTADVVELVPETRRRGVGAGELAVGADRDRVGGTRPRLGLGGGQDADQQHPDEQDDCPGRKATKDRRRQSCRRHWTRGHH